MYSVRLFFRSVAREVPILDHHLAYSWKSRPKEEKGRKFDSQNKRNQRAGARRQTKAMGHSADEMRDFEEPDDEELNISMAGEMYDAHMGETRWKQSKRTLAEYGQKYYKPKKEPALLSFEDMQQIRHLRTEEEWPVSALAKHFPATERIIEKVCKSKRNLSLEEQIKHDKKIARNWILLRKGKLEISDELRQHCLKFANRVARPITSKDLAVLNTKPPLPAGTFMNLLKAPEKEEKIQNGKKEKSHFDQPSTGKTGMILHHLRKKITLEEARKEGLEQIAERGSSVSEDDKLFVCGPGASKDVSSKKSGKVKFVHPSMYAEKSARTKPKSVEFVSKWDSSGESKNARRAALMAPIDDLPEHIIIPNTSKKPGAIYRVEDCFYDENGDFMYRVPGLKL